jgi:hypothetical protein
MIKGLFEHILPPQNISFIQIAWKLKILEFFHHLVSLLFFGEKTDKIFIMLSLLLDKVSSEFPGVLHIFSE